MKHGNNYQGPPKGVECFSILLAGRSCIPKIYVTVEHTFYLLRIF